MFGLISAIVNSGALFLAVAYNPPVYFVNLQSARPGPDIAALERAGILKRLGSVPGLCGQRGFKLAVTERGQEIAASRGWDLSFGMLSIPLGKFNIERIGEARPTRYRSALPVTVRFEANANAAYLKRFGNARSWHLESLPHVNLTLADAGLSRSVEVPVYWDNRLGLTPIPGWHDENEPCSE